MASSESSFRFEQSPEILNSQQIQWLNRFLDFLWLESFGSVDHSDLRVRVSDECFVELMAPLNHATCTGKSLLQKLKAQSNADGPTSIALRTTVGPTDAFINFHCDAGYAFYTTRVALNDPSEYDGGRLCFFVDDTLHVLERPTGSVVQHHREVLHAVTAWTRGTRKSLFVVDCRNGLGEGDVVEVKMVHVERFIAQK